MRAAGAAQASPAGGTEPGPRGRILWGWGLLSGLYESSLGASYKVTHTRALQSSLQQGAYPTHVLASSLIAAREAQGLRAPRRCRGAAELSSSSKRNRGLTRQAPHTSMLGTAAFSRQKLTKCHLGGGVGGADSAPREFLGRQSNDQPAPKSPSTKLFQRPSVAQWLAVGSEV